MGDYILVGHLSNREAIYARGQGLIAIEKDHTTLVEPTEEERAEAYDLCSFLKPRPPKEGKAWQW